MTTPDRTVPGAATWYFDVISPFSYLALGEVEQLAERMNVLYRPILFAALLQHWSHLGPAEIPPKRLHTYRLCVFEAARRGIAFRCLAANTITHPTRSVLARAPSPAG